MADNPIDKMMCQDILINLMFGGARELTSAPNIMLLSTTVTVSQIKFTLKCLLNLLHYFIGLLVI